MPASTTSTAFCAATPFSQRPATSKTVTSKRPRMCTTRQTPSVKVELDQIFSSITPATSTSPSPAQVEQEYKRAKEVYKAAKAAAKALRKEEEKTEKAARKAAKKQRKEKEREMQVQRVDNIAPTQESSVCAEPHTMTVCGGKSCQKLGAEVVAGVLGRAGLMPRGEVPSAPCMKMCGGGGPTVRIGETCVKVDLKSAVLKTVEGEQPV